MLEKKAQRAFWIHRIYLVVAVVILQVTSSVSWNMEQILNFNGGFEFSKLCAQASNATESCTQRKTLEWNIFYQNLNSILQVFVLRNSSQLGFYFGRGERRIPAGDTYHSTIIFFVLPLNYDAEQFQESLTEKMTLDVNVRDHVYFLLPRLSNSNGEQNWSLFEFYHIQRVVVWRLLLPNLSKLYDFFQSRALFELFSLTERSNFHGSTLRVVAQEDERYKSSTHIRVANGTAHFIGGAYYDTLMDLKTLLNFTMLPVAGTGWAKLLNFENESSLTGMGAQVIRGEADISISKNSLLEFRVARLTFLPPISTTRAVAFYREPPIYHRNVMTIPFSSQVWTFIVTMWILTFLCFMLCSWYYSRESSNGPFSFQEALSSLFLVLNGICLKGWDSGSPRETSARILCFTCIFSSSVIYSFYTGSFVATISAPQPLIKTVEDFFKYGFQVFTYPGAPQYAGDFITDKTTLRNVINQSRRIFLSNNDSLLKVLSTENQFAFIVNGDGLLKQALDNKLTSKEDICHISSLQTRNAAPIKDGMFINKGSPLKEIFTQKTIFLLERGHVKYHFDKSLRQEIIHCTFPISTTPMGMEHTLFAYQILAIGFVLAAGVFLLEKMVRRRTKHYF